MSELDKAGIEVSVSRPIWFRHLFARAVSAHSRPPDDAAGASGTTIAPRFFVHLKELPTLEYLKLDCEITDECLQHLKHLPNLRILYLVPQPAILSAPKPKFH